MRNLACLLVVLILVAGAFMWFRSARAAREERELADARAEAQRWYERLGGQVMNLHGEQPAVRQALADASERYTAAGSQLEQARTVRQFALARETALEGLAYVRAARVAMGIDPGPDLPPLAAQRGAGAITKPREVDVQGHTYRASPNPNDGTPYYYPGGRFGGRPVPAGWYSEPWWKTALVAGAAGVGSMLIFDALFSPSWGDSGYGYDAGFAQGFDAGEHAGDNDFQDGDYGGYDGGDGGGYAGADSADFGDFDSGGDFGGGDFGGGDFGGGDF